MDLDGFLDALLEDGFWDDPHVSSRNTGSREQSNDEDTPDFFRDPSHVCRSCGEEYDLDRDVEIDTCRSCGGVKVERA